MAPTTSLPSLYLQGRFHWNKRTPEDVLASIHYFEKAIAEDPTYALAYAGLADAYLIQGFWVFRPPREVFPQAKQAALKALQLDASLAEALTSLAFINTVYDWEWLGAEQNFRKAILLKPSYAVAHQWHSGYLFIQGRWDEAFAEMDMAQSLDPLSLIITSVKGELFRSTGKLDKALQQYNKVLELDPNFAITYYHRTLLYLAQQRYDLALADIKKAKELSGDAVFVVATLGITYALKGEEAQARAILNDLLEESKKRYIAAIYFGGIYYGLGEYEMALDWYEKAVEEWDSQIWFLWRSGFFKELYDRPRFRAMIAKAGLK